MSGKNLPGGLIHIKDNADGTQSYVFDKFCIFEKGYINSIYNPLGTLSKPSNTVPVFNYGTTNGILFDFTDNKGDSITVNQAPVTGNYALTFPAINTNDTLVTTNLAQTLTNKTLTSPAFSGTSSGLMQNSSQYCFEAYNSLGQTDATGSGAYSQVFFDTIKYQVGTGYDSSTGVFTAPIAGKYLFASCISSSGYTSSNTYYYQYFTVNGSVNFLVEGGVSPSSKDFVYKTISKVINLAANETVYVGFNVGGNTTNNVSVLSGTATWFQGYLLLNS